jgi:hypothetical protein
LPPNVRDNSGTFVRVPVYVLSQILVIAVANSRLTWALRGPRGWTARGAVANQDIGSLAVRDWQNLERPMRAVGVNVAGEAARVRVEGQLARGRLSFDSQTDLKVDFVFFNPARSP